MDWIAGPFGWFVFGAVILGLAGLALALRRSFSRWSQPPPGRDQLARQADARLWSTMNMDQL